MDIYDVIVAIIFSIVLLSSVWMIAGKKPTGVTGDMNLSQVCRIVDDEGKSTSKKK